uniref:Ovule protein n=1 Tax=Panagrolaimus sp. ES5 TaxID=591445 RepID=A0AC34GNH8_9BILA
MFLFLRLFLILKRTHTHKRKPSIPLLFIPFFIFIVNFNLTKTFFLHVRRAISAATTFKKKPSDFLFLYVFYIFFL